MADSIPQADPLGHPPTSRVASGGAQAADSGRPPLQPTHSTVKQDAASYGIRWRPERIYTFMTPKQARVRHQKWLKLLGRIGWTAKGIVYALIGGLACKNAVGDQDSSASPQGAFVLIGAANGGRGLLIVLAIAIVTYSVWRFWEGAVGQGYDDTFGNMKNFFKFRLSPLVSGSVYVAYAVLVIEVIPRDDASRQKYLANSSWPNSWHDSNLGKAGLILVGIAFLAATIVQLEQFCTKSFHNTLRVNYPNMQQRLWKPFRYFVLTCGHIGVLGRAGIFLFAAILFFRTVRQKVGGGNAFGSALAQLQSSKAGDAALFIMGFCVIVYGLFCVLNIYARIFPTPPPSGIPKKRHWTHTGGEPPLTPRFGPGHAGFHPMSGISSRHLDVDNKHATVRPSTFTPMTNALAKASANGHAITPSPNALAKVTVNGLVKESVNNGHHGNGDIEMGLPPS